jgi:hypothetical protein
VTYGAIALGNVDANQKSVAYQKSCGEYARLVLLMKCGSCGYESPVETDRGPLERQCYCCGSINTGNRQGITYMLGSSRGITPVEI